MSAEELLPCPFCGETANALQSGRVESYGDWIAGCDNEQCMTQPEVLAATKIKAIAAWNRRTPPAMSADHIGEATNMVAPVEAVAWRLRRVGETRWNFWDLDPCVHNPVYADATRWEVQPLYTHPAPIKPSGDTGELREKMKRAIWTQLPQEDANMGTSGRIADAILGLIQSERAGSSIGQNDQPGLAFSDAGDQVKSQTALGTGVPPAAASDR